MSTLRVNNVQEAGGAAVITSGVLDSGSLPVGAILQVVSTAKTDTFSTTSASFVDVTGLSVSITPKFSTSKILILSQITHGFSSGVGFGHFKIVGGNTASYVGQASGSRVQAVFGGYNSANLNVIANSASIMYLDSPATTSEIIYKLQVRTATDGAVNINRSGADGNDTGNTRGASSITVMEVAA